MPSRLHPRNLVERDSQLERQVSAYGPAAQAMVEVTDLRSIPAEEVKVRLWDQIDGTQTAPLPLYLAQATYLRMVVYVCSLCKWSTTWPNTFSSHKQQEDARVVSHSKAEVMPAITAMGSAYRCTGCNSHFQFQERAAMHLQAIQKQATKHANAELLLLKRFGLEPLASPPEKVGVAVTSQQERMAEIHQRRRRHRRHRSSHGSRS